MSNWSNLAKVVYKRTYARKDNGFLENWTDTVDRVIRGNVQGHNVSEQEIARLKYYLTNRKAGPAGRGWWYSGAPSHKKLGGVALAYGLNLNKAKDFRFARIILVNLYNRELI